MSDHNPFPVPVDILPDDDADLKHAAAVLQQERERRARIRAAGGRDAYVARVEAENKALREAAGALLAALAKNGRPCGVCYTIATWAEPLSRGGSAYRCDRHHKHDDPDEDGLSPSETEAAVPLRTLRSLLETKP